MAVLIIFFLLRYVLLLTFDNMLSALHKNYEVFADFSYEIAISWRAWQPHKLVWKWHGFQKNQVNMLDGHGYFLAKIIKHLKQFRPC